jgi:transcriptional regulator with XRE-family HTH domain
MSRIADRFERLLEIYRRPDGGRWGGQDLEDATGGVVTRSYVSTFRKGNIENPGFDKLRTIAKAMGFPPELWFDDSSGAALRKIEAVDEDATVAERLEHLLDTIMDEKKGRPYTSAEVAKMSLSGVTEEEVVGIRSGEIGHPTLDQVLALSEAFGIDPAYFTRRVRRQDALLESLAQEESTTIVHKTLALSEGDRRVVLDLLDHLGSRSGQG